MPAHLTGDELDRALAVRDLTDPQLGHHALQDIVEMASAALEARWGIEAVLHRGPPVVAIADNYDRLGFTPDAASRDGRYSRYVDGERMLRSHSSALVPAAARDLAAGAVARDILLVCPGMVYRRDAIDRLHTATPHQLDLWRVGPGATTTTTDLDEMCSALADALFPGRAWRWEPRVHPYTLDGRQVDVDVDGAWVEVWECGLAHPAVLAGAGLAGWTGLALGMGLDRLLMVRKGIPDIRLLRSDDPRVARQMHDLSPYVAVSPMPAAERDLSIVVDEADAVEDLGDRVRDALGADADAVESVEVVSRTPRGELPATAIERMGVGEGQDNALVHVVLRRLDRTLTATEANELRDRIYAALHRGGRHEWTRARGPY